VKLSVVLILYNAMGLLQEHFDNVYTLVKNEEPEAEFLFVDNRSTDGSLEYIREHFPEAKIIQQAANVFFAPSANRGIQEAKNELILLLNLDIKIAYLNLSGVKELFQQDPLIFSISPKVIDPRDQTQEHLFCFSIRKGVIDLVEPANFDSERLLDIPYGTGGAIFLRRSYFLEIGGFREIYAPFYWDDPDLGIRAISKGWKNIYFPGSWINHYHSSQISACFEKKFIKTIYERNRLIFFWLNIKHVAWRVRFLLWLPFKLGYAIMTDGYFFGGFVEFIKMWNHVRKIPSQSFEEIIKKFSDH
jgi:GT2 family glycosyltransferase